MSYNDAMDLIFAKETKGGSLFTENGGLLLCVRTLKTCLNFQLHTSKSLTPPELL